MYKLAILFLIFALARAHDRHNCFCQTHLLDAGQLSEVVLLEKHIKDFENIDSNCNVTSQEVCVQHCLQMYVPFTHNYDLLVTPEDNDFKGVILGQVLCDQIKQQILHKRAEMQVYFHCKKELAGERELEIRQTIATQFRSKYDFSCLVDHKFEIGDLVVTTTPLSAFGQKLINLI